MYYHASLFDAIYNSNILLCKFLDNILHSGSYSNHLNPEYLGKGESTKWKARSCDQQYSFLARVYQKKMDEGRRKKLHGKK